MRKTIALMFLSFSLLACQKKEDDNLLRFPTSAYNVAVGDSVWVELTLDRPASENIPVKLSFSCDSLKKHEDFHFFPADIDVLNEIFLAFAINEKSTGFYFHPVTTGEIRFTLLTPPAPLMIDEQSSSTKIHFSN